MGKHNRGGGGYQPGQNWEGTRAKKKYEERARKAAGRGSGRGSSMQEKGPETVTLTHQSEAMVRDLLDKLGKRSGKQAHQGEDIEGEEGEEEGTEDEPERAERNPNVDEEDLKKKVREELHKKGFEQGRTEEAIGEGLAAETDDDRAQNFNQQKKRLLDRAKDWLVLNLDPEELPEAFKQTKASEGAASVGRGPGRGGRARGGRGRASKPSGPVAQPMTKQLQQRTQMDEETQRQLESERERMIEREMERARSEEEERFHSHAAKRKSESLKEALDARRNDPASLYSLMRAQREKLPSWEHAGELVEAVESNQVTIVAGETGCGKTTQLPQFLLDSYMDNLQGSGFTALCTQPRRISATSVAERVAKERGEKVGETVGYQIRLESCKGPETRVLFMTTGVLLRRLHTDPLLAGISHVIVDEVHERSLDSDFLLVLLRDLLPHRPTLKVVLMSATLDAGAFERYFQGARTIHVPGFTHPVKDLFLEDLLHMTGYSPSPGSEAYAKGGRKLAKGEEDFCRDLLHRGYSNASVSALRSLDVERIDYDLALTVIRKICEHNPPGAVLVFLPGLAEIAKLHGMCLNDPTVASSTGDGEFLIALHSTLSSAEQGAAFDQPPQGFRKVVIATNIAETSITIDDVVYVVDPGKAKENGYDPQTRMQTLQECWISQANAKQRRGRAGRVQPGVCFKLYTRYKHDHEFKEHSLPEIKRVPLEGLCLQIQLQRMGGGIKGFLSKAMEAPQSESIDAAIGLLRSIGALDSREQLTNLGYNLAQVPVDVRIGKMLLFASIFGCIDPILTIGAFLTSKSPFIAPVDKREEADQAKQSFATEQSDHLTIVEAFNDWRSEKKKGKKARSPGISPF